MAKGRKSRGSGVWTYNIPKYNAEDKFIYFTDLTKTDNNSTFAAKRKTELATAVREALSKISGEISDEDESTINSALNFLKNVAESERAKEIRIVQEYKDYLQNILPPNAPDAIQIVLNGLNPGVLNDPGAIKEFYANLTTCINLVRKNADDYKNRLALFIRHTEQQDMSLLPKDDVRFRFAGDVHAMLSSVIGISAERELKQMEDSSFSSRIRTLIGNNMKKHGLGSNLAKGENLVAFCGALTIDIEEQLQKKYPGVDLSTVAAEKIEEFVNNYFNLETEEITRLQNDMYNDFDDFIDIIRYAKEILQIRTEKASNTVKEQKKKIDRLSQNAGRERKNLRNTLLRDSRYKKLLKDSEYIVTFNTATKSTFHGNIDELRHILSSRIMAGNVGAGPIDTLAIGSWKISKQFDTNSQRQALDAIDKKLTGWQNRSSIGRKEDVTTAYSALNEDLRNIEEDLNKKMLEYAEFEKDIGELFIYHESLKLYKSMESNVTDKFHGREMIILNYIGELYSANGLADLQLPQQDALSMLALNVAKEALGNEYRTTLTRFLSIFAGLLMFGDVQNIAIDAAQNIQQQSNTLQTGSRKMVHAIHLYLLNGVYVPASMVLTYTYQTMIGVSKGLNRGARVTLSTAGADKAVRDFLKEHGSPYVYQEGDKPYKEYWPDMGEAASAGTKVRVAFLATFVQFIQDLFNMY